MSSRTLNKWQQPHYMGEKKMNVNVEGVVIAILAAANSSFPETITRDTKLNAIAFAPTYVEKCFMRAGFEVCHTMFTMCKTVGDIITELEAYQPVPEVGLVTDADKVAALFDAAMALARHMNAPAHMSGFSRIRYATIPEHIESAKKAMQAELAAHR